VNITLTPRERVTPRCAICHDDALGGALPCPECRTLVHSECQLASMFPTLGCTRVGNAVRA